ncbi:MAG: type II secretion system protein [bacterium]
MKKLQNKKGYSLVEVLFTLMILSVGLAGTALLMTVSIKNSIKAKNQVIAAELAQEGVELVKNINDNGSVISNGTYRVDNIDGITSSTDYLLYQDVNGSYSHKAAGGTASKFFRAVVIGDAVTGGKRISAAVTWGNVAPNPCNIANSCVSVTAILP